MQLRCERLLNLVPFAGPQHSVVDKNAGQLGTDRTVRQSRSHRRVHSAAQRTDDTLFADLLANLSDRRIDIGLHRPGRLAAANLIDEVTQQLRAFRSMSDFGVELETI